jgi:hypothetical protein
MALSIVRHMVLSELSPGSGHFRNGANESRMTEQMAFNLCHSRKRCGYYTVLAESRCQLN